MAQNEMQAKLASQSQMVLSKATEFAVIQNQEQYGQAAAMLRIIKGAAKDIADWCDPDIKRWHEGHKFAVQRKRDLEAPLKKAESILKGGIQKWKVAVQKQAQEARRAAEEEARLEAEAERRAQAEALRAAGDEDLADIAESMPVSVSVVVQPEPELNDGISTRDHVVVEVLDKEEAVRYIVENWILLNHLVDINMKELRKMGVAQRENFKLPGCKCTIEKRIQVR